MTASVVACLAALGFGDVDVRTVSRERRPDESVALYTNPTVGDLHDIPRTHVLDHTMHARWRTTWPGGSPTRSSPT